LYPEKSFAMKRLFTLFIFLFLGFSSYAQTVMPPDSSKGNRAVKEVKVEASGKKSKESGQSGPVEQSDGSEKGKDDGKVAPGFTEDHSSHEERGFTKDQGVHGGGDAEPVQVEVKVEGSEQSESGEKSRESVQSGPVEQSDGSEKGKDDGNVVPGFTEDHSSHEERGFTKDQGVHEGVDTLIRVISDISDSLVHVTETFLDVIPEQLEIAKEADQRSETVIEEVIVNESEIQNAGQIEESLPVIQEVQPTVVPATLSIGESTVPQTKPDIRERPAVIKTPAPANQGTAVSTGTAVRQDVQVTSAPITQSPRVTPTPQETQSHQPQGPVETTVPVTSVTNETTSPRVTQVGRTTQETPVPTAQAGQNTVGTTVPQGTQDVEVSPVPVTQNPRVTTIPQETRTIRETQGANETTLPVTTGTQETSQPRVTEGGRYTHGTRDLQVAPIPVIPNPSSINLPKNTEPTREPKAAAETSVPDSQAPQVIVVPQTPQDKQIVPVTPGVQVPTVPKETTRTQNDPVPTTSIWQETTVPQSIQTTREMQDANVSTTPIPQSAVELQETTAPQFNRGNMDTSGSSIQSNQSFQCKTGYMGIFELGYGIGVFKYGMDNLKLNFTNGIKFCPNSFLGIGVGVRYYSEQPEEHPDRDLVSGELQIPVFLEFRQDFSKRNVSPYFSLGAGNSIGLRSEEMYNEGLFINPSAGLRFKVSGGAAVNVGISYEIQNMEYSDLLPGTDNYEKFAGSVSFNAGISF